jgi:hypothetical protein
MFLALCVSEIGAVVDVDCQTELAFVGAEMGFDEVGVFGEVDGFESETTETFAAVHCCFFFACDSTASKL